MAWQDDIRKPSINGVRFEIKDSNFNGGHKLEDGRENKDVKKPGILRNGRKIKTYSVNGFVFGQDYINQAKKIELELTKKGKVTLVHPTHGTQKVFIESYTFNQKHKEGLKIEFSFTAWEFAEVSYPTTKTDKVGKIKETRDKIKLSLTNDFVDKFSVAGRPEFVKNGVLELIEELSDKFDEITSGISSTADAIGKGVFEAKRLYTEARQLIEKPKDLIDRINFNLALADEFRSNPPDMLKAYRKTRTYGQTTEPFTPLTETRKQQLTNQESLKSTVVINGIANSAVEAVIMSEDSSFESNEDAVSARDELLTSLDDQIQKIDNDLIFSQLMDLKTQIAEGIPGEENSLPNIIEIEIPETTNSLALAYDMNESLDKEDVILARNKIAHAGFITPRKLEVIR